MSSPKLVTNPPQGSGLIPSLVDRHWEDLSRGKPGELLAAVCLLQPVGTSQRRTKDGVHRTVTYELVRLEPVRDAGEADDVTWQVTKAYERRTSGGSQGELPLHDSLGEQRERLLGYLEEWRVEEELSVVELDERWVSYFGGPENAASSTAKAGSLLQLTEFTRYCGALVNEAATASATAGAPGVVFVDGADDPDADEA